MFHFITMSSSEQVELTERAGDKETALKLTGFPGDNIIVKGWKLQPLHMPPLVC